MKTDLNVKLAGLTFVCDNDVLISGLTIIIRRGAIIYFNFSNINSTTNLQHNHINLSAYNKKIMHRKKPIYLSAQGWNWAPMRFSINRDLMS